ncbi:MAG: ABC transporter substrate-binding protein [Planctomycetota bacterium]
MRPLRASLCVAAALAAAWFGARALRADPSPAAPASPANAPIAPASPAAPTEPAVAPVAADHVYTGCAESPDDVNPLTAAGAVARRLVLARTHDGLLAADPATGDLVPAAAERFDVAADGSACTFTLRQGLRFADGSEVTLDDVLLPWELAQAGHLALGFVGEAMARIATVDRVGERAVRVTFRDRHFAAVRIVGEAWLVVSRRFFVQRVAERAAPEPPPAVGSAAFAALLAQIRSECGPGTGPYRLDNAPAGQQDWRPRQDLLLRRNEHSWQRRTDPQAWTFGGIRILFRDQAAATNELFAGALDWFSSQSLPALLRARPGLTADYRLLSYDYDALGVYRVAWNVRRGALADVRVRRALARLFDVAALREGNEGLGAVAVAHCKPSAPECPKDLTPPRFDPEAARAELRAAGFDPAAGTPLRLVLLAPVGTEVLQRIVDLFADACRQAGVELDLRQREFAAYVQEQQAGAWDGLLALQSFRSWGDPWDLLHSEGTENFGGYRNAEVDRLADAARVEPDAEARAQRWQELHRLVFADQPAALLVHPLASILLHRRIEGAVVGRRGLSLVHARVAAPSPGK